jgi:hypothetical protein
MAYSDFNLSTVKRQFDLKFIENIGLFADFQELKASDFLEETLTENLPLALGSNTEKARSELIITPILVDLRKLLNHKISIFSGISFTVDIERGLNGNCDFLINQSAELLMITAPVITLVEAKKEDLNSGLGQCIAEMIAAQIFNERENNAIETIYGAVTSGTNWRFLKLKKADVYIDLTEYYLTDLNKILGILAIGLKDID